MDTNCVSLEAPPNTPREKRGRGRPKQFTRAEQKDKWNAYMRSYQKKQREKKKEALKHIDHVATKSSDIVNLLQEALKKRQEKIVELEKKLKVHEEIKTQYNEELKMVRRDNEHLQHLIRTYISKKK